MVTGEYALMRLKPSSEFDQARQARNTLPGWFALTWAPKRQNRVYAELGRRGVTEMVPVAEYRFVSLDRHMTMAFNPREFEGEGAADLSGRPQRGRVSLR